WGAQHAISQHWNKRRDALTLLEMERLSETGWYSAEKLGINQGVALGLCRSSRAGLFLIVTSLVVSSEVSGQQQQPESADSSADESVPPKESWDDSASAQPDPDTLDPSEGDSG